VVDNVEVVEVVEIGPVAAASQVDHRVVEAVLDVATKAAACKSQ